MCTRHTQLHWPESDSDAALRVIAAILLSAGLTTLLFA
jgi:hypothetical protein